MFPVNRVANSRTPVSSLLITELWSYLIGLGVEFQYLLF